jgi:hypothetical protein
MTSRDIPPPPNKPEQYECCDHGCCPCIFDYYWDALARWEETVSSLGADPDAVLAELGRKR